MLSGLAARVLSCIVFLALVISGNSMTSTPDDCRDSPMPFVCFLKNMTLTPQELVEWQELNQYVNGTFPDPSNSSATSKCVYGDNSAFGPYVACPRRVVAVKDGAWIPVPRNVYYQVPLGQAPEGGWPVVMMYQGSFFSAELTWSAASSFPFGAYYQTQTVKSLLDAGYAVITPSAFLDGLTFWDTNLPPWDTMIDLGLWPTSGDAGLLKNIFEMIKAGDFGPLNIDRMYATGISSGGYMTSRMAFSYQGMFRSLAVAAGSYYYCAGPICADPIPVLPGHLPSDHPPTLFMSGSDDPIVPTFTVDIYVKELQAHNISTDYLLQPGGLHQWIEVAPTAVLKWFQEHP